ncbi:hypothetical protein PNW90_01760 [[Ruminococcus] gnavus]|nr:hypothetical protein [Mediterraneibacter gnavus]MDB8712493.1 hypothetical protein [Mediterraneibacter gnavus]
MMYPYQVLSDKTEIVHSHLFIENGVKKVIVHFERPTENGFDSARCSLPDYTWIYKYGYSANEISFFEQLLHENEQELYKLAYKNFQK